MLGNRRVINSDSISCPQKHPIHASMHPFIHSFDHISFFYLAFPKDLQCWTVGKQNSILWSLIPEGWHFCYALLLSSLFARPWLYSVRNIYSLWWSCDSVLANEMSIEWVELECIELLENVHFPSKETESTDIHTHLFIMSISPSSWGRRMQLWNVWEVKQLYCEHED